MPRFSAIKRSDRLRAIGWVIVASGLVASVAWYWYQTRFGDAQLDDTNALGYGRSLHHGVGVMMGQFGLILTEWQETLTSPVGGAILIAIGGALLAAYFFRVAWVLDQDE
jgi:hypothetical protein